MTAIALDVHAHLVPIASEMLARIPGVDAADSVLTIDGNTVGVKALYQPEQLVSWMDGQGIEKALVSAPPPTYRTHLRLEEAARWTDYLNDGLDDICRGWPARLFPAFHLPGHTPDIAANVAQRAARDGRYHFSMPAAPFGDLTFSDKSFDKLWEYLDDCCAFVFLHPGACCDGRLRAFYLENLLGNPFETTVAAAHLLFGGVLERFPNIRFCLAHGGGCVPMLAGRWQRGFATSRPGIETTAQPPEDLISRFYADCVVHDGRALRLTEEVFGHDKILFGSDWPFPMGLTDTAQIGQAQTLLSSRERFSKNAEHLVHELLGSH